MLGKTIQTETAELKRLVLALDADKTIYNDTMHHLFLFMMVNYGDFLLKYGKDENLLKQESKEIEDKIDEIIYKINELFLYNQETKQVSLEKFPSFEELKNKLLMKFRLRISGKKIGREEYFLELVQKFRNYLDIVTNDKLYNMIFYLSNKGFFHYVLEKVKEENYSEVYILSSSSRQSTKLEKHNSKTNQTRFFFLDLQLISDIFTQVSSQSIFKVLPFCMGDLYNNFSDGHCYQLMKEVQDGFSSKNHPNTVYDETKFTLFYAIVHYIGKQFREGSTTIAIFDDRKDIHLLNSQIFTNHKDLFYRKMTLEFYHYEGRLPQNLHLKTNQLDFLEEGKVCLIQGTGDIDYNFSNHVKQIAVACGADLSLIDGKYCLSINPASKSDMIEKFKQMRAIDVGNIKFFDSAPMINSSEVSISLSELADLSPHAGSP